MSPDFKILFEDTHLIVLSKSAGLLSQGDSSGETNLVDQLRGYLGRPYVGLIHRLDRGTSGLMVIAKRTKSANRLTALLQSGELKRTYQAWVWGKLQFSGEKKSEHWKDWLLKDEKTNITRVVAARTAGSKEARLTVTPIEYSTFESFPITRAEYVLETGRSHQIRVQSLHHGFPLLGDVKYSRPEYLQGNRRFTHPLLHSSRIEFPHPMSKEIIKFEENLNFDAISMR